MHPTPDPNLLNMVKVAYESDRKSTRTLLVGYCLASILIFQVSNTLEPLPSAFKLYHQGQCAKASLQFAYSLKSVDWDVIKVAAVDGYQHLIWL